MDSRSATLAEEKELGTSVTPSINASLQKETEEDLEDARARDEKDEEANVNLEEEEGEGEYPTGFRMAMIVVALVLSIFLVSTPIIIPRWVLIFPR